MIDRLLSLNLCLFILLLHFTYWTTTTEHNSRRTQYGSQWTNNLPWTVFVQTLQINVMIDYQYLRQEGFWNWLCFKTITKFWYKELCDLLIFPKRIDRVGLTASMNNKKWTLSYTTIYTHIYIHIYINVKHPQQTQTPKL